MDIFGLAELDSTKGMVKLGADGAGLFAEIVALASSRVVNALNGADDGGSAASASLLEIDKFVNSDRTTLNLNSHILGQLHQALIGDRGQDGSALGGDIYTVLDAEEVSSTSLVDILFLFSVQIELAGILTTMAGCSMGLKAGSIVTTDLVDTSTQRGTAVIVASDNIRIGLEATFEIRSDGGDEDKEEILVSWFHTHGDARANQQRTEVKACASAVRGNKLFIQLDNFLAHLNEFLGGQFGHDDAAAGALQTGSVLIGAEHANLTVFATISLQSLKGFLTIVQAGGTHVDRDGIFGADFYFAPFSVAIVAADIIVGFVVSKTQV